MLGPAPMPHSRLKGRYRWHLLLKSSSSEALHRLATQALEDPAPGGLSRTRVQVDVDPLRLD
jgi:primosomal protein N' (replication factor Y)